MLKSLEKGLVSILVQQVIWRVKVYQFHEYYKSSITLFRIIIIWMMKNIKIENKNENIK